ncbi:craniofacial development protein 2-like protein, partial [Tanacetum coccineum]
LLPQLSSAIDYRRLPSFVIEKLYFPVADGCSTREGNNYKLWYSETRFAINRVGVILASRLRYKVLHVDRRSERIMSISLVVDEETVNVISAYAPHVGPSEEEKKSFWDSARDFHRVFGYGVRNEEGHMILEFATAHNLVVINSFFMKRDANLITFESGGRSTDIDYMLVCREDLKACKDCLAFPNDACSSQHKLLVVDTLFKRHQNRREVLVMSRIMWKNLKCEAVEAYKIIIDEEKESLGVLVGTMRTHTTRGSQKERIRAVERKVEALVVDGVRRRGRPKLRWKDKLKYDMKELLLTNDTTSDRGA